MPDRARADSGSDQQSKNSSIVAVIPARWGSTRFPGKALAPLAGKPVIVHVCEQAAKSRHIQRVIVATDDQRIADVVTKAGFQAMLTRGDHPNGTSRIAEVAAMLDAQIIVNVQGDEPRIEPELIDRAIEALLKAGPDVPVSTVASPFMPGEDPADPNLVKVAIAANGRALYFSRSLIPFRRDAKAAGVAGGAGVASAPGSPLKHVGLYVYRRDFLPIFIALPATPLELAEQLEQLRILEHGHAIAVAVGEARFHGVDTPEQLAKLEARAATNR
ncbi:MAG: 3-deoxy-manno-octulosonate cytidylyltransferase [Planctomycetes bacterium]|nr:3-deoxy-manno-octulosonate cytidylyltransferase [Planctomycetota bacterium]